jgi:hypothetical protein
LGEVDPISSHAAHRSVTPAEPPTDAWARLALLASASGGAAVPSDSLDAVLELLPRPGRLWPPPPLVWLFIALALALTEWAARRLRGLA